MQDRWVVPDLRREFPPCAANLAACLSDTPSHGCVRVENSRMMAALLLGQPVEAIDNGIAAGHTRQRQLPVPMPIFIVYQTAYAESDGSIQFRADPYQRDDEIWRRLTRTHQLPVAQDSSAGQRKG